MTTTVEPERELVRRLLPFAIPVLAIAAGAGAALGGAGAAWSAAIAIVIVALNLVAHAGSMAWAARVSPMILMAVGLGGYVVRIAAFTVALLLLDRLAWFSPLAFVAAFAPATIVLLVVEMRLLAGRMQADLWYFPEKTWPEDLAGADHVIAAILAEDFHPPATQDFVFDCYFSVDLFGIEFCFNFIIALVVASVLVYILLFFFAFRKPRTVPGKLQSMMELGLEFVREQIALPMLGPAADRFLPLLVTFFFFIFFMNMFEVVPWVNFSASSRVAFPLVLALIAWVTYNAVGIAKHGFFGYLKFTCIIPSAPAILRYTLLLVIEFVSNIIIRPITLTIRLAANFVAGHFLLALAFLGTEFFFLNGGLSYLGLAVTLPISVALVAFEVFVAVLQAFIFAILTASYIGGVLAEEH